jgi:hypothetical protein
MGGAVFRRNTEFRRVSMDFNFTLNIFTLGCGAYCLYTFLKLLTGRKLFKNALLIPKEREVEDCTDEEGYISYLLPRLGVLTFSVLIYGIVSLINDMLETPFLPYPWPFVPLLVLLGVLVWYSVGSVRANRDYFGF